MVCALYKFVALPNYQALQQSTLDVLEKLSIRGTLLLADEGINGTIAGSETDMHHFLQWLNTQPRLNDIKYKVSYTDFIPFKRTKVKLKKEIVTMGIGNINPLKLAGSYVQPEQWNQLISEPDVVLVDTRNEYEIKVGKFENAINPNTTNFRGFPQYVDKHLDPNQHKKVAMYCTGGIRCEKAAAYLEKKGFEEVFHLEGGILNYLGKISIENSKWQGECFVFDDRVTVDHDLNNGNYDQCHACRMPINDEDKKSDKCRSGISCPYCYSEKTERDRDGYAEREKQVELASQRGAVHIGLKQINQKN